MLVGPNKQSQAWKPQAYPVPTATRRVYRWKASMLRNLRGFSGTAVTSHPATIMVPALYNFMPAECVALGWLNEIDTLVSIRQRMASAARITGWDAFTFHTLHNVDRFYNTTIAAVRETWVKEGSLSNAAIQKTKRQFANPYDYHRIAPRLVENLVFQSSLLDWVGRQSAEISLHVQVTGTALLSALVSTNSISFKAAVESALKFSNRWDETLRGQANAKTDAEIGWFAFTQIRRLLEGRISMSMGVSREDLPVPDAPSRPFWYTPTLNGEPILITTAQEAANALETMNLASWASVSAKAIPNADQTVKAWLVSPMHPMARVSRRSLSNYLLATPDSVTLFLDNIATICREPLVESSADQLQNRLRLSRMKVTGP